MPSLLISLYSLVLCGLLVACGTPVIEDEPGAEFAADGLFPVKSSGFAEAYVARDAQLSSYRKVNIAVLDTDHIEISQTLVIGTTKRDWTMTPEREKALQQAWAAAMDEAFSAYARAESGPDVLRIAAKMTRIAPARPTSTTVGGELQPFGSSQDVVGISMEFRLYNQDSGALLAVIRDSRTMTSKAMSRTAPVGIQILFGSWAALLHTRIAGK
jgi:hypothetical protein